MTRRVLLGGAAVILGILLLQPFHRNTARKPAVSPPDAAQTRIEQQRQDRLHQTLAQHPEIAKPMASYRVHEDRLQDRVVHRGGGYVAETSAKGLHFEAGGAFLDLRASRLEQGGAVIPMTEGVLSAPAFADVRIDRGPLTEQYIFENNRAEQLFKLAHPVGTGALRVVVKTVTDLTGRVIQHRRHQGGWADTALSNGGVCFTGTRGEPGIAYHDAVAVDASGRKAELDPVYKDGEIILEVPAAFMSEAVYPVLIDPWLELDFSSSGGGISNTTAVSQTPTVTVVGGGNPWVAWSELVTANGVSNFEVFFRYFNGFNWVDLGGSSTGNGISNNTGDSLNPTITQGDIGPYIAWEDSTSGTRCIYLKHWDGSSWVELNSETPFSGTPTINSASAGGVSLGIGTVSLNPVLSEMFVTIPSKGQVKLAPVLSYETTNPGPLSIVTIAYFPGDPGQALVLDPSGTIVITPNFPTIPKGWYAFGGGDNASQYAVLQMSNTAVGISQHPSLVVPRFTTDPVVAWHDTRAGTHDIMVAQYTTVGFGPGDNFPLFPASRPPNFAYGTWAGLGTTPNSFASGGITGNGVATPVFSINPTLALNGNNPAVAWEHHFDVTDSDVYMLQFDGGGTNEWVEVNGSASARGISNTLPVAGVGITQRPSLAIENGIYYVVWREDEPGNAEIYVKRNPGGGWVEAGFQSNSASVGPTPGIGGISKTIGASLRPVIASKGGACVVWQDFANGSNEIFVRRFFENVPSLLRQTTPGGGTVIPFGSSTTGSQIDLRGTMFSETLGLFVRMEVEIVPVGSPFTGNNIQTSGEVQVTDALTHLSTAEAVVAFSGLTNQPFQWRARSVDEAGNSSAWISAGGSDGTSDFGVNAIATVAPGTPASLVVSLVGGVVTLSWTAPAGGADNYNVKRSTVAGGGGYPAATIISSPIGTSFSDTSAVAGATYFYVVSAVRGGLESAANSNEVTITVPAGSGGTGSGDSVDKKRCGLMGGEALVLLAGAILLRRRRR